MANIAIYWDFENIHASLATLQNGRDWYRDNRFEKQPKLVDIGPIMEYAASLGNININRAYANWTFFVGYGADLQTHTVDLVQLYPRGAHGKNGADIRLATDVIEDIARHPQIDTVVVVGGDSDYIAIAQRVRERGHRVVGIGVQETTNRYWISSCNEFKFYASLMAKVAIPAGPKIQPSRLVPATEPTVVTPVTEPGTTLKEILQVSPDVPAPVGLGDARALLRRAMKQLVAQSGGAAVKQGMVKQMMLRLDPAFDETNIGYPTFSNFIAGASDLVRVARGQHDNLVSLNGEGSHPHPAAPPPSSTDAYANILKAQAIRLPELRLWDAAMEETFALLGDGRYLPSPDDYKESLAIRLKARQIAADSAQVKRVLNVLYRCFVLKLDSQPPSFRLVPEVQTVAALCTAVRQSLTTRILDNLKEPPDASKLAETLFGEAPGHVDEARALIEWYSRK